MGDCILFDCDTGSDDAIALMLLLSQRDRVTPVAVTCVGGNTSLENVVMNNLRILKLFGMLGKVPLYRGSGEPLVPVHQPSCASHVHGNDGMGGRPDVHPAASRDLLQYVEKEHAADAIVRISKEHVGNLKVVATGPLTNLALAVKLDPELPKRLSGVYIMGGTRSGQGNVTATAEFNFYFDPESVWITMYKYPPHCPVHLIDWEFTLKYASPWEWYDSWLSDKTNDKSNFAKMALLPLERAMRKRGRKGAALCDAYAMAIALCDEIASKPRDVRLVVELGGYYSRGSITLDDYHRHENSFGFVRLYDDFDLEAYHKLLENALKWN